MNDLTTLKNAVVFRNSEFIKDVTKLEDENDLQVIHKEEKGWKVSYFSNATVVGQMIIANSQGYLLESEAISKMPNNYNSCYFLFGQKEGEPVPGKFTNFPEVVAHFWNGENVPISIVVYYLGNSERTRAGKTQLFYNRIVKAVDANEYGFVDEDGNFWKVLQKDTVIL